MIQEKRSKRGALAGLAAAILVLVLVTVLENTLPSTSQLFVVLKKGAVYSLVAVSMNLVNGFTGLFSLGQAGFMLLGAYTYGHPHGPCIRQGHGVLPVRRLGGKVLPA